MLFAELDPNTGWYISAFAVPLIVVFFALWLYQRRENRRRRAIDLSGEFAAWGLTDLSKIFSNYSIGDYSGLYEEMRSLRKRITSHGLPEEFRDLNEKLNAHFMKDQNWRDRIQKAIDAANVVATGSTIPGTSA